MVSVIIGAVLVAGAIALLLYSRPQNGVIRRASRIPMLDMLIPLGVTAGLALGCSMIVAGLLL